MIGTDLDARTLMLIAGAMYVLLPLGVWFVLGFPWKRSPILWCAGSMFGGVGIVLMGLRGRVGDELSYVLGQPLILLGILLVTQSLRPASERPPVWWRMGLVCISYAVLLWWLLSVASPQVLGVLLRAINLIPMLVLVAAAWRIGQTEVSRNAQFIAGSFFVQSLAIAANMVNAGLGSPDIHTLAGSAVIVLSSLTFLVMALVASMGYLGLSLERALRHEVQQAQTLARAQQWRARHDGLVALDRERLLGVLSESLGQEIRQPLTAALLHVQHGQRMLRAETPPAEYLIPGMDRVIHNIRRAEHTIDRTRHLMAPVAVASVPVAVSVLLQDAAQLIRLKAISRNVNLHFPAPDTRAWVEGDALQLTQAVLQVILNAIAAVADEALREVHVALEVTDRLVRLQITDTGPGFAPSLLERTPGSFQGDPMSLGGIGLYVVQSILDQHRGGLVLNNQTHGGAEVTLSMPRIFPADAATDEKTQLAYPTIQ
ncbi:sensor histidine kinase [Hydrogenophaga sp.]|uniref:sensor histidine kinase n=1 Tax=Hydrogenophaga sp. TaxID=1904254 RepID=UPI003F6C04BB